MDQVVRRRYGRRKQMSSSMTNNNDNIYSNASISVRSSTHCLVSPSRRRRQLTVGRKSLEWGTERENGCMLRQGRSEEEEEDDDMDDDVDLEGRGFQTKVNTWSSLETSTTVNANFKPSFSTLIWLAQVMTAFSLLGMVFMVRIGSEIICIFFCFSCSGYICVVSSFSFPSVPDTLGYTRGCTTILYCRNYNERKASSSIYQRDALFNGLWNNGSNILLCFTLSTSNLVCYHK